MAGVVMRSRVSITAVKLGAAIAISPDMSFLFEMDG
jgi:hypothetical protein